MDTVVDVQKKTGRQKPQRVYYVGSRESWWFALWTYHLGTYMRRWIMTIPWRFTCRLHRILRSDADRDLHCHPFSFLTFLLTGGYTEILADPTPAQPTRTKAVWRRRFSLRWVHKDTAHRLVLDKPVWTLVFATPSTDRWGFFVGGFGPECFVHKDDYPYRDE